MTFWDHLDELRKALFRSVILFLALMVVIFLNKTLVFEKIIFAPADSDFILFRLLKNFSEPFKLDLINIELSSQFFTHISVSATLALIFAVPFILHQLWTFVKPGLYEKERRAINLSFAFAAVLFFLGVLVGYFFVFPLTVRFLGTYQVSELVENQISLKSYISMFTRLILIMGLVFEMPALVLILSRIKILSKRVMKRYRKHAFVALVIIAAIITPSGDAFTLFVVSAPLYLLYEFSVLICRDFD